MKITNKLLIGTSLLLALSTQNAYTSTYSLDELATGKHLAKSSTVSKLPESKEKDTEATKFGSGKGVITADDFSLSDDEDEFAALISNKKTATKTKPSELKFGNKDLSGFQTQINDSFNKKADSEELNAVTVNLNKLSTSVKKINQAHKTLVKDIVKQDDLKDFTKSEDFKELSESVTNLREAPNVGVMAIHTRVKQLETDKIDRSKLVKSEDVDTAITKKTDDILNLKDVGLRAVAERIKRLENVDVSKFALQEKLDEANKGFNAVTNAVNNKFKEYSKITDVDATYAKSANVYDMTAADTAFATKATTFTKDEVNAAVAAAVKTEADKVAALIRDLNAEKVKVAALEQQVVGIIAALKTDGNLDALKQAFRGL